MINTDLVSTSAVATSLFKVRKVIFDSLTYRSKSILLITAL